jgi:hypothetical protein
MTIFLCLNVYAQNKVKVTGFAQQGGVTVRTSSAVTYKLMETYPLSTVTVYLTGTQTLATLYSDNNGTPRSNPLTASATASYDFYIDPGIYDIKFSGVGIANPFTIVGFTVAGAIGTVGLLGGCDGINDTQAFTDMIALIGPKEGTITLPFAVCAVNGLNIPSNITVDNTTGLGIKVNSGNTLIIQGPIVNPAGKTFVTNVAVGQGNFVRTGGTYFNTGQQFGVVQTSNFIGADLGAKINAADALLGSSAGTIYASPGNIATQVTIGANHTLFFLDGNFTVTANTLPAIRLKSNSRMVGSGWGTIIAESTAPGSFTLMRAYNNSVQNFEEDANIYVGNFQVIGANPGFDSVQQTISMGNCLNCTVEKIYLNGTRAEGIGVGGGSNTFGSIPISNVVAGGTYFNVYTSVPHNFHDQQNVTIAGVGGIPGANGNWIINVFATTGFTVIPQASVTGTYTSGGSVGKNSHAENVWVKDCMFFHVASQNIGAVNFKNIHIINNIFRAGGQPNGPGTSYIDIEPNAATDTMENYDIRGNIIDARGSANPGNGIIVQAVGGVTRNGPGLVNDNTIIGGHFNQGQLSNEMANGIYLINTKDAVVTGNAIVRTGQKGLYAGGTRSIITNNKFTCVGGGGNYGVQLVGMTYTIFSNNYITDLNQFGENCGSNDTNIVEDGNSSNNVYSANVGFTYNLQPSSKVLTSANVGTGLTVYSPNLAGNTTIGSGSNLTKFARYRQTITPTSVSANTSSEQSFTVTGLSTSDIVYINPPSNVTGLGITGVRVSSANTIAITFSNSTGGALTPPSGTYSIAAFTAP